MGYYYFMKYFLAMLLLLPLFSFAHSSDERYVDGYVVDLSTAPIAPWVGEKTGMSFVFIDPITLRATSSVKSAVLTIDVSMRTNKKKPETIFTSEVFTIENGGFTTDYIFSEEGAYDIHLQFIDDAGKSRVAGFRKQVRDGEPKQVSSMPSANATFLFSIFMISILAFIAGRFSNKKE